jgi:archaellum biogenesis protein FlaJ (TadC family)
VSSPESPQGFWRGVKQEAIAGVAVLAIGSAAAGIFYLVYTVPTKLDDVLSNQEVIQRKVGEIEDTVQDHDVRIIKLEMGRSR